MGNPAKKDHYYTRDHEWIHFQGAQAYTGICPFKLIGFKEIQEIIFTETVGFKKQGETIACIRYKDYLIKAHMPVDGKVIYLNDTLIKGNWQVLLQQPEGIGWIAFIDLAEPHERKGLLLPAQYHETGKRNMPINHIQ